ncbi:MAG TPA: hypothetical protein PKW90_27250, partial [Myxococcota bacterium]|nr:hypothetical protein [Myxococcota bacterium]
CAGQPADEVLFYFAGHGKLGRNSMLLQMLPDPRGNRYLDVGELAKRVRKAAPKAQFTAILDACQTPGGPARADRLYFPLQNPFLPAPRPTEAFLSSSSPLMPVADVDAYANELFAQLQEGSAADSDCNGTVSLVEAHLYVGLLQRHYDLSSRIGRQRRTSGVESKEDCVPYSYLVYSPSSEGAAAFQLQVSPQEPAWEGVPGRSIPWKIQALHRASYELHFSANDHNFPVLRIHPRPGEVVDANRILEQNFQERRARVHLSLVTGTFSLPSPAFQDVAVKAIDLFSGGQLRYYPYHANLRFGRPSVGVRVLQGWGLEQGQLYTAGWIGPELGWWLRLSPWPGASTPWCWTRPELQIGVVGTAEL